MIRRARVYSLIVSTSWLGRPFWMGMIPFGRGSPTSVIGACVRSAHWSILSSAAWLCALLKSVLLVGRPYGRLLHRRDWHHGDEGDGEAESQAPPPCERVGVLAEGEHGPRTGCASIVLLNDAADMPHSVKTDG